MIVVFQFILAIMVLGFSLLLLLMIRQIGVLAARIPARNNGSAEDSLVIGTEVPLRTFQDAVTARSFEVPFIDSHRSFLLFLSFSCPVCQALLRDIGRIPDEIRGTLALMVLDQDVGQFTLKVAEHGLEGMRVVDAYGLSHAFNVRRAPSVLALDSAGVVTGATPILTGSDLIRFAEAQLDPNTFAKESSREHANSVS